ncbi:hypothetical protein ABZP36_033104 [Zizania latifolia]
MEIGGSRELHGGHPGTPPRKATTLFPGKSVSVAWRGVERAHRATWLSGWLTWQAQLEGRGDAYQKFRMQTEMGAAACSYPLEAFRLVKQCEF